MLLTSKQSFTAFSLLLFPWRGLLHSQWAEQVADGGLRAAALPRYHPVAWGVLWFSGNIFNFTICCFSCACARASSFAGIYRPLRVTSPAWQEGRCLHRAHRSPRPKVAQHKIHLGAGRDQRCSFPLSGSFMDRFRWFFSIKRGVCRCEKGNCKDLNMIERKEMQ